MNCLLVPCLGFDLTLIERLANSIDYPIRDKVVVSTGDHAAVAQWQKSHPSWRHIINPQGPCLASAWNMAPKIFDGEPSVLILNDDAAFLPGWLQRICQAADHNLGFPFLCTDATESFSHFVWNRCGWETLGTFDENFWPIYFEDADMKVRVKLSGSQIGHMFHVSDRPVIHEKRAAGNRWTELIHGCYLFNREYFYRKWGCLEDHLNPIFKTPFNDVHSMKFWQTETPRRQHMRAIWDTFMSFPNPSTYT